MNLISVLAISSVVTVSSSSPIDFENLRCKNGGTPTSDKNSCLCPFGRKAPDCSDLDCGEDGILLNGLDQKPFCFCDVTFEGIFCENKQQNITCSGNGKLNDAGNCDCEPNFSGEFCADIEECVNGARDGGKKRCLCDRSEYGGHLCEIVLTVSRSSRAIVPSDPAHQPETSPSSTNQTVVKETISPSDGTTRRLPTAILPSKPAYQPETSTSPTNQTQVKETTSPSAWLGIAAIVVLSVLTILCLGAIVMVMTRKRKGRKAAENRTIRWYRRISQSDDSQKHADIKMIHIQNQNDAAKLICDQKRDAVNADK